MKDSPLDSFLEYYNDNVSKNVSRIATQIADELGEEIDEYVGSGSFGYAFTLKSNKVLKLTRDKNEINLI